MAFVSMSLVAAIPAGFLAVTLVLVFLNHAGGTTGMLLTLAGITLVPSFAVALIPFAILVFAPKDEKPDVAKPKTEETDEEEEEDGFADSISEDFGDDESMQVLDIDGNEEEFDLAEDDDLEDLHDTFVEDAEESGENELFEHFGETPNEEGSLDVAELDDEDVFEEESEGSLDLGLDDDSVG